MYIHTDCKRVVGDGEAFDPTQAVGNSDLATAAAGDDVTELVTWDQ